MDSFLDLCFDVRRLIYKAIRYTGDRLTVRCLLGTCKLIHSDIKSLKWGQMTCQNRLAKAIGKQGTMAMFRWFEPIGIKPLLVYTTAIYNGRVDAVRSLTMKFTFREYRPIYKAFVVRMDAEIYKIIKGKYKQFGNDRVVILHAIKIDNIELFEIAEKHLFDSTKKKGAQSHSFNKVLLLEAIKQHNAVSCLDYFWTKGALRYMFQFMIDYRYNAQLLLASKASKGSQMHYIDELIRYLERKYYQHSTRNRFNIMF